MKKTAAIIPCLLNRDNTVSAGIASIGSMIAAAGKEHLWDERKEPAFDTVVIHYISAASASAPFAIGPILETLCKYDVSSHYLISRRGRVYQLVPEDKKAWHAGGSIMPEPDNRQGVNEFSVGIELAATALSGFTLTQYRALFFLCADMEKRHNRKFIYTGHESVAGERAVALGLRKDIKSDPGPLFDWERFIRELETARRSS
ncbi:MAG: N-acetylmuramoyl-L-alanine amidase [Chitinispirillaceae bacterium]|jgi:N-acetyl-anhydromuramyl-L-alanine amidase AmpD|nr:N-acetylmuramoyl-L-alanine amidase [Chitinispirillaceae bacterium]